MNAETDIAHTERAAADAALSHRTDYPLLGHYTILIYPFIHDITSECRRERIRQLGECWSPWWARLGGDIPKTLDDSYFFLPYIREVIFPETALFKGTPPGDQYAEWVTRIRRWNAKGLDYFCGELSSEAVLRITYKPELLSSVRDIAVAAPYPDGALAEGGMPPARVEWVDAALFPAGLGFMMLKLVLDEADPRLSRLVDLNYYLRTVHPPFINWRLARLRVGRVADTMEMRDLLDFLTQGMTDYSAIIPSLPQYMERLRHGGLRRYSEGEAGQVYGERCHYLSYACVDVKDDGSDEPPAGDLSVKDRLLFEFASGIQVGRSKTDPTWVPSPEQVSRLRERNRISVWRAWRGMALKESVVFLGTEDISFNRHALPHNVESDYLPLYLYSLYQKYQLFIFADELMRKGAYVARHLEEVRGLMDRFMDFRNRYWFNEVTRKPLGGELYRKFQQGLESTSLYELVRAQVNDLKEYYEERRQRRIGALLNLFTFAFMPLSAVIGIFGMSFFTYGSWLVFTVTFALVGLVFFGLWKWWTEEPGPPVD